MQRMELDYSLSPCTKINSKWIKDLNIRSETIHYMGENIGVKLMYLGLTDVFNLTSKAEEVKANTTEWGYFKLKSFYIAKKLPTKPKGNQLNERSYVQKTALTGG